MLKWWGVKGDNGIFLGFPFRKEEDGMRCLQTTCPVKSPIILTSGASDGNRISLSIPVMVFEQFQRIMGKLRRKI